MLNKDMAKLIRITQQELAYESPLPSLRGIACEWGKDGIILYFYNNGPFCDDLKHDYCCLAAEVSAQYDDAFNEEVIRIDEPLPLPQHVHWAYQNAHASFSSSHPKISARHKWLLKMTRCDLEKIEKLPSWRGVAVDWDEEEIMVHLYYEGEFTTDSSERFQRLCEGISDDCNTKRLYVRSIRCDPPSPLPSHEYWAFLRDAPTLMACEHGMTMENLMPSLGALAEKSMNGQISSEEFPSLRGITLAKDQNKTCNVHYYNDGPISQELKDHYRSIGTEMLSQSGCTRLHENFVRLDSPEPLPQRSNWIYKNLKTAFSSLSPQISFRHKHLIVTTQAILCIKTPLPFLRGIAVDWDGPTILMHCYHDRKLSEKEKQLYQAFGQEVLSYYPVTHLDQRILQVSTPALPEHEYWVFKNA